MVTDVDVQWLMTPESPSVEEMLAGLVNRPASHRQAACRGMEMIATVSLATLNARSSAEALSF